MTVMANTKVVTFNFSAGSTNSGLAPIISISELNFSIFVIISGTQKSFSKFTLDIL